MPNKDSIFKELFEDKEIFYDFLKAFLPKDLITSHRNWRKFF
ncbi:MAG: hypothetical protein RBQ74_06885 [Defluviitoga tunisiensis]|jgi:predicted transposase YdaD|nr:hypothetical protein [Defluviitoga tunisiensis]